MAAQSVEFAVRERATYVGKAGDAGSFKDAETGDQVKYAEAHAFDFDSPEGNVQRILLRANKIDEVADFDLSKLKRYADQVDIEGVVVVSDRRGFFRPTRITKASAASA